MIEPTVYGQLIIALVYVPLLTFSGVEGKTFPPMALTVSSRSATAFVLSLTFVPALIAILVTGKVQRAGERLRARPEGALPAGAGRGDPPAVAGRSRRGRC